MQFIYSVLIDRQGRVKGYYVFDTNDKKDKFLNNFDIHNIYGIKSVKGKLKFSGYKFLIYINDLGQVNRNGYTVIGKMIEHKSKKYLLISGKGVKTSCSEAQLKQLNSNGLITNLANSASIIRMLEGTIPSFTKQNKQTKIATPNLRKDTILNIGSIQSLSGGTPGVAKKFVAKRIRDNKKGIAKQSISSNKYDNINEVVCYELGKLFGVNVCEASLETYKGANDWVVSVIDEEKEGSLRSAADVFSTSKFMDRFSINSIQKLYGKSVVDDFNRMVIFDTLVRQTDRHINNFAFCNNGMYPLYDNGRCLFWDTAILEDISDWDIVNTFQTNEHGYGWQYLDGVLGFRECSRLIRSNVSYQDIHTIVLKYYSNNRATVLSNYIYKVYKIILGKTFG